MEHEIPQQLVLPPAEREALPDKVRQYISALEARLDSYSRTLNTTSDELRKKDLPTGSPGSSAPRALKARPIPAWAKPHVPPPTKFKG